MLKYILAILLNYKLTPIKELGEENELARSLYAVEKKNCISLQGHQHGVSIQYSVNLGKIFLQISRMRKIAPAWILAKFFV